MGHFPGPAGPCKSPVGGRLSSFGNTRKCLWRRILWILLNARSAPAYDGMRACEGPRLSPAIRTWWVASWADNGIRQTANVVRRCQPNQRHLGSLTRFCVDERSPRTQCSVDGPTGQGSQYVRACPYRAAAAQAGPPLQHRSAKRPAAVRSARGLVRSDGCCRISHCSSGAGRRLPPRRDARPDSRAAVPGAGHISWSSSKSCSSAG